MRERWGACEKQKRLLQTRCCVWPYSIFHFFAGVERRRKTIHAWFSGSLEDETPLPPGVVFRFHGGSLLSGMAGRPPTSVRKEPVGTGLWAIGLFLTQGKNSKSERLLVSTYIKNQCITFISGQTCYTEAKSRQTSHKQFEKLLISTSTMTSTFGFFSVFARRTYSCQAARPT